MLTGLTKANQNYCLRHGEGKQARGCALLRRLSLGNTHLSRNLNCDTRENVARRQSSRAHASHAHGLEKSIPRLGKQVEGHGGREECILDQQLVLCMSPPPCSPYRYLVEGSCGIPFYCEELLKNLDHHRILLFQQAESEEKTNATWNNMFSKCLSREYSVT